MVETAINRGITAYQHARQGNHSFFRLELALHKAGLTLAEMSDVPTTKRGVPYTQASVVARHLVSLQIGLMIVRAFNLNEVADKAGPIFDLSGQVHCDLDTRPIGKSVGLRLPAGGHSLLFLYCILGSDS